MADSFDSIWREVRLYCPSVPSELCKHWVRDRFRHIMEWKQWSWAMAEAQFNLPSSYNTGTVTLTLNSSTVTGAGTAWTADMVNRQFKCRNYMWTILTVDVALQTLTLDRTWPSATESGTPYIILQAYVTVPSDFHAFHTVKDPANNWRIWTNFSSREIDAVDPARTSTGNPSVLANHTIDPVTLMPRYELWPHVTTAKGFVYIYWTHHADFDSSVQWLHFTGEILKFGALADLCCWPGTPEAPNPMFNLNMNKKFEADFMDHLLREERNDEEIYLTKLWYETAALPYAPLDGRFYQTHAI